VTIVPKNVKNVDLPLIGLTGQLQHIISVNQFKDLKDPRNAGGPSGIAGEYKVTFVLSRPGFNLLPERNYSFVSGLKGDSHLATAKPAFTPHFWPHVRHSGNRHAMQDHLHAADRNLADEVRPRELYNRARRARAVYAVLHATLEADEKKSRARGANRRHRGHW